MMTRLKLWFFNEFITAADLHRYEDLLWLVSSNSCWKTKQPLHKESYKLAAACPVCRSCSNALAEQRRGNISLLLQKNLHSFQNVSDNISWSINTEGIRNKAQQRVHLLGLLRRNNLQEKLLTTFSQLLTTFSRLLKTFSRLLKTFSRLLTTFSQLLKTFSRLLTTFSQLLTTFSRLLKTFSQLLTTFSRSDTESTLTSQLGVRAAQLQMRNLLIGSFALLRPRRRRLTS